MSKYVRLLGAISCISIVFYVAYKTLLVHNPGTIIFLTGTASSGKSSVYHELRKQLDPAQYQFFNQDDFEETVLRVLLKAE